MKFRVTMDIEAEYSLFSPWIDNQEHIEDLTEMIHNAFWDFDSLNVSTIEVEINDQ